GRMQQLPLARNRRQRPQTPRHRLAGEGRRAHVVPDGSAQVRRRHGTVLPRRALCDARAASRLEQRRDGRNDAARRTRTARAARVFEVAVTRSLLALGCALVCALAQAAPPVRSSAPARNDSPAPPDVRVETKQTESGQWTVTVRRPGYLVALRAGDRTS